MNVSIIAVSAVIRKTVHCCYINMNSSVNDSLWRLVASDIILVVLFAAAASV